MRRIWINTALTALLCAALCAGARAADPSYSGRIDPETGAALDVAAPLDGSENDGRVHVGSGVYYDFNAHCYIYALDGSVGEVRCSAADGMVLSGEEVTISATQDAPVSLFWNGAEVADTGSGLTAPGEYTVTTQAGGRSRQLLKFTIVGPTTNALRTFTAPDGFYVSEATRDEQDVALDRYSVNMEAEGAYHIAYTCTATDMTYTLDVAIDRTPPALAFGGSFDDGMRARSAVTFEGLMPGDTIRTTNNGEAVTPEINDSGTGGTFYDTGSYTMTVYDAAGNSSTYDFIIMTYFNATSLLFFAVMIACIASVIAYMWFKRKNLKIG